MVLSGTDDYGYWYSEASSTDILSMALQFFCSWSGYELVSGEMEVNNWLYSLLDPSTFKFEY